MDLKFISKPCVLQKLGIHKVKKKLNWKSSSTITILITHDLKKFYQSYSNIECCNEGALSKSRTQDETLFTISEGGKSSLTSPAPRSNTVYFFFGLFPISCSVSAKLVVLVPSLADFADNSIGLLLWTTVIKQVQAQAHTFSLKMVVMTLWRPGALFLITAASLL